MGSVQEVRTADFRSVVGGTKETVLVDFWAPWCGPCRALGPELEAAAKELGERVRVVKVNVDEEPALAEEFGVQSIPNMILFKGGQPIRQLIGFMDKARLVKAITEAA